MRSLLTVPQVWQLALAAVGDTTTIASVIDTSKQALVCAQFSDPARYRVMSAGPWPFLTRRKALVEADPSEAADEWGYTYDLPAEALAGGLRGLVPHGAHFQGLVPETLPFVIEAGSQGQTLVRTNLGEADAVFTLGTFNWDVVGYPTYFLDAWVAELAARIAMPLTKDAGLARGLRAQAQMELDRAFAEALREGAKGEVGEQPESELIRARS